MFSTPGKRKAEGAYNSPTKVRHKGFFKDSAWHCNCNPRLPASHFQVRKKGPNTGRWFYTCQEPKDNGCGFFLWDEDAAPRMTSTVIGNSWSEPAAEPRTPVSVRSTRVTVERHTKTSNKWLKDKAREEEEEFGDLSSGEEREVAAVLNEAENKSSAYRETPRKAIKTEEGATPGNKRKWADIMSTPHTSASSKDDAFSTPNSKLRGGLFDGKEGRRYLLSPSATPTPSRFRDASESGGSLMSTDYDITVKVIDLLKDLNVDFKVLANLLETLNTHALRTEGILRSRDITRVALKARDAKITELQQKITALETERDIDKKIIQHLKNDMSDSIKGRGRGKGGRA